MATVKNFGLAGVASNVQFKKGGGKIDWDDTKFSLTDKDGTAVALCIALVPSNDADAASKQYVDSVATGLDVKNSVRVATVVDLDTAAGQDAVYTAGTVEGLGTWTNLGAALVIDGVTLVTGDRVLVQDEAGTDQEGNGIWVYTSTGGGTFARASDADNTPSNEVSGGMFTFVEEGTVNADQGFVMSSPNGIAVVDSATADILLFTQFSGAQSFTAGDGLNSSGNTLFLDIAEGLGTVTAVVSADEIAFNDQTDNVTRARSFSSVISDLDILTNPDGTNPLTVGEGLDFIAAANLLTLDINGLTLNTVISGTDNLVIFDGANNRKITISELVADNVLAFTSVTGDSGTATADTSSDTISLVGDTNGGITTAASDGPESVTFAVTAFDLTTGGATLALGDFIIVADSADETSTTSLKYTFQDMVDDLDIPNAISTNGIVVRTTDNTFASRTIVASATASEEGIVVTNGDGVAGNPTVGLEIDGLTLNTVITGTDNLVIFDGANNRKITIAELVTDNVLAYTSITGDSGTANAATSSDTIGLIGATNGGVTTAAADGSDTVSFAITLNDLTTGAITLALGDFIAVNDSADAATVTALKYTFQNVFDDLDVPNAISTNGLVTRTTDNTFVSRTIVASTTATEEGIVVTNGDGVAGNPAVGLEIDGLTLNTVISGTDKLVIFDGVNNRKINVSELVTDAVVAFKTITTDTGVDLVADISVDAFALNGATFGGITTLGADDPEIVTFSVTAIDLATGGAVLALADFIVVADSADEPAITSLKYTFQDMVDDLDIPNAISTNGIVVRTTDNTFASRTIVASATASEEGIVVTNGDGVAGNPTVGLEIDGLTLNTVITGTDNLVIFDGANNRKVTVSELFADAGNSYGQIKGGDDAAIAAATSSNEQITFNGTGINIVAVNAGEDADTVTFALDIADLTAGAETLLAEDTVAVNDGTATLEYSFTNIFDDLDVPNAITVNGIVVRTTDNTYASRTIEASVVASEEGIIINDGDGVAGNPEVGLDIDALTLDTTLAGTETLVIFNGTNNVKTRISDLVASGDQDLFLNVLSDAGTAVADNPTDTLSILGGTGISTSVTGDVLTITNDAPNIDNPDQDLWATFTADSGTTTADSLTDSFAITGGLGVTTSITGDAVTIVVDNTRITDGANTFVDTDEVAGKVTINTDDGTGGAGTQLLATFSAATSSSTVTDANFLFTNEDSVDTLGNDEIQICAAGSATDIDVRIKPQGAGEVILGDTAANATLSASDGTAGFDLTLEGGDGTAGDGGNVIIIPGDGSTGTDGTVCITDADSVNVMCFEGDSATTAVSFLTVTNSPTGGTAVADEAPRIEVTSSDTDVDISFLPKGTGTLSVSGTTTYEVNVTEDDDIPNKKFVNTVLFDTITDTALGTGTNTVPLNADITRCVVNVTSVYAANVGFDIGTAAAGTRITDDSVDGFVDWQTLGIYIIEIFESVSSAASLFAITKTGDAGTGTATIRFEYAND